MEIDIRPHTIETSHMYNMTLCPEGISSHSVKLVATLAFLIFCSHFEANMKMLHACSVSTSAFNSDASFHQNSSYFHEGFVPVFVTQFILLISSFTLMDVCGESGFVWNTPAGIER